MDKFFSENAYIYFNEGDAYVAENRSTCIISDKDGKRRIHSDIPQMANCKGIRIDIIGRPVIIKVNKLEVKLNNYYKKILLEDVVSNGMFLSKGIYIFEDVTPQIFLNVPWNEVWLALDLEYEIVSYETNVLKHIFLDYEKEQAEYIREIEKHKQRHIQMRHEYDYAVSQAKCECDHAVAQAKSEYEQAYIQLVKVYEDKYQKLWDYCQHQVNIATERIKLLKDKLSYIQSSKIYRILLKHKVDALGLWKDIEN